ncbi:uncharacterized protein LOC128134208 [Lactuca sativa]|uniref:uncharacterized protein LOC128134208 n=1 Tax=Lactuca sativa TaxID=4236 RepID=UPI0022B05B67|nr:uncharacterized protein LOC128134208 [Lactuca sativa]
MVLCPILQLSLKPPLFSTDFKPTNGFNKGFYKSFGNNFSYNNSKKTFSGNNVTSNNSKGDSSTSSSISSYLRSLTGDQFSMLLQLISDKQSVDVVTASANMAGTSCNYVFNNSFQSNKWVVDYEANQHMTSSEYNLNDVVSVSNLNLRVDHPNESTPKVQKIGNMSLSNNLTLFDVIHSPWRLIMRERDSTIFPHSRLGHPAEQALDGLQDKLNFNNKSLPPCEICHKAKQTRESFTTSLHNSKNIGDLFHLDVWGPYKGTWVYLLKSKDEVFSCILSFLNLVETQFSVRVKIIRSDNGTEFVNHKVKEFFETKGDAILAAVFLINRTPSSALGGMLPFEKIYKHSPTFDNLRIFGCLCFATKLTVLDKFSLRSEKYVWIGYSQDKKGYKLLSLDSGFTFFSRDVKFYESVFPFKMKKQWSTKNLISSQIKSMSLDPFSYDESNRFESLVDASTPDDLGVTQPTNGSSTGHFVPIADTTPTDTTQDDHLFICALV